MANSELTDTATHTNTARFFADAQNDRGAEDGVIEDPDASGDGWRVQRVYVNGPGQLGQIVKVAVLSYANGTTGTPSGSMPCCGD